ncbi:MAG: M28 family peptidase, partial [Planctomycetota bacterium]
ELVHCWLGNYLHVDYEKGNWCEALTTWFANYGSAVREKRDVTHRKKVSRTFSLRVFGERDYPLRNFRSKRQDFENDIGYGKGSMVFHMLERDLGRQVLVDAVRHVVKTRGGTALGWDDLVQALSEGCGKDLSAWFKPWLDRPGAPILRIGALSVKGRVVTGTILQTQDGPAFPLRVPLVSEAGEERIIATAAKETVFRVEFDAEPRSLALDPDHHIFRRVRRDEVAPCLEAVLNADKKIGSGDAALLKRLGIPAAEPALPKDAAVFLVGIPDELRNELLAGARRQMPALVFEKDGFTHGDLKFKEPGDGVLISYARPDAPPVTFFHGNGEEAFARARYIPYYAAHGWVVFKAGRPIARGDFTGDPGTRRRAGPGRVGTIETDLLRITEAQWLGRRAGTPTAYKLANELRGRLFQTGATVLPWPGVTIPSGRVAQKPALHFGADKIVLDRAYPFHWSADATKLRKYTHVEIHPAVKSRGALIILPENATYELMAEYAKKGAAAVLVVAADETMKGRANQAAWIGLVPPAVRSKGRNPETLIASLIARSGKKPLLIPALYVAPGTAESLKKRAGAGAISVSLRRDASSTSNLIGVFGPAKQRGILLSAHWDGVGRIDGTIAEGAADNAAGVAVVLWVATQLKRDADAGRLGKPVVVALFGAEEAGLIGSRQFAAALKHPKCSIAKPLMMINVDAIGGGKDRSVYVIGRSKYPDLLNAIQPNLEKKKLPLGRDIDKFAFRLGSDHWPLHEAGVPAISLFGTDYRAMNTTADTLEKVDVGMLRDLAKAVYRTVRELAQ